MAWALERKGWNVVPQVGVPRFRIDLGVVHHDRPGDILLGVERERKSTVNAYRARLGQQHDRTRMRTFCGAVYVVHGHRGTAGSPRRGRALRQSRLDDFQGRSSSLHALGSTSSCVARKLGQCKGVSEGGSL